MSDPLGMSAQVFRAAEARRVASDVTQGRVFSNPGRSLVLSYPVKNFPWVTSSDGDEFEVSSIELTFEWWDGWLLSEVEVGGTDTRFRPNDYVSIVVSDAASEELPVWVREFVASVDPVKVLAGE